MERIAVISDIHGNIPALEAVLTDIEGRGIRRIFCLGDLVGKGPDSEIAVDMIQEKCELVLQGNWDFLVAKGWEEEIFRWHYEKIGIKRAHYLGGLPMYQRFYFSGRLVTLCHAAPHDVFHRVPGASPIEDKGVLFLSPKPEEKDSDMVGYGDIHGAYVQNFFNKTLFNTGSVGNPLDIPQASYAILEGEYGAIEKKGFSINIVRVAYDIKKAILLAEQSGMPEIEAYIHELITGQYRGLKQSQKP